MTKDTGGPAFPNRSPDDWTGMTLRDWLAGQALQSWVWDNADVKRIEKGERPNWGLMAEVAYAAADAMIAERNKP